MGKAARNEVKKLTATFCNNVGVALVATGIAIPLIGALYKTDAEVNAYFASLLTHDGLQRARATLVAAIVAFALSFVAHAVARSFLWDVED
jgi:hypothetical protein